MSLNQVKYFSSGEFARLCGVHKKTLFHYDEIGLFKPDKIMENGYRYYSQCQLELFNVIYTLKEIGMPLKEIKVFMDKRSPEKVIELFKYENQQIEEEIRNLRKKQQLMVTKIRLIEEGLRPIQPIVVEFQEQEFMVLSSPIQEVEEDYDLETYAAHIEYCEKEQLGMGYLPGSIIKQEHLIGHEFRRYSYYFSKVVAEDYREGMYIKPDGMYVVGYLKGYYDKTYALYEKMMDYIDKEGFKVIGDAYEEVLIDEVSVKEKEDYILKISILIQKNY